ncbi:MULTISPECIES: GerAB/ArcD/ProY family transporter [Paenibacillus]|uniref:GerAB/ArcD/ProY family transporter n=1 Tax=Paenibacillus TaxID=44249 RepID=UPI0022B93629|nr:endospore germination permease [Paenibacillus caseinilyticus]MCZ8522607.1 endospore germination permease [Paenibacillus caseinilyticus]
MQQPLEKGRIAGRQFVIIAILYTIGDPILVIPSILAEHAQGDAWLSALLAWAAGLLFLLLFRALQKIYPGQGFTDMCESALGRTWGGFAAAVALLPFWTLLSSSLLREFSDFMTTQIMPETPIQAIYVIVVAVALYGLSLGLEPLVRSSEILFPWVIGLLALLMIFLLPEFKTVNLEPVLAHGWAPVVKGSYAMLAIPFMEVVTLLMIVPFVKGQKQAMRSYAYGVAGGGAVVVLIIIVALLALGPDITARSTYPTFVMAKKIRIGNFLERMEIIITIMWMITIYFKLAITMYALVIGTAKLARLKSYRPLLVPFGTLLVILAQIITPNSVEYYDFTATIWPLYAFSVCIVFPGVLLVAGKVRGK